MIWNRLLETYENNKDCTDIAPIAHTKIKANIGILIDSIGIFRMAAEIPAVTTIVPCTAESECRSSNIAPHPIHDNLSYVGNIDGYEKRHEVYMQQLHDYAFGTDCSYAKAIYRYLENGTIMNDISEILEKTKKQDTKSMNVIFCVYHTKEESVDLKWTDYYLNRLPKNGMCMLTGQPDYIPKSYPVVKRNSRDLARLIMAEPSQNVDKWMWDKDFLIGYTASQKILHTLQALLEDDKSYLDNEVEFLNTIYNTVELT